MAALWDASKILGIKPESPRFTCIGISTKKKRCGRAIRKEIRGIITQKLNRLSTKDIVTLGIDPDVLEQIRGLAAVAICCGYHGPNAQCPQDAETIENLVRLVQIFVERERSLRQTQHVNLHIQQPIFQGILVPEPARNDQIANMPPAIPNRPIPLPQRVGQAGNMPPVNQNRGQQQPSRFEPLIDNVLVPPRFVFHANPNPRQGQRYWVEDGFPPDFNGMNRDVEAERTAANYLIDRSHVIERIVPANRAVEGMAGPVPFPDFFAAADQDQGQPPANARPLYHRHANNSVAQPVQAAPPIRGPDGMIPVNPNAHAQRPNTIEANDRIEQNYRIHSEPRVRTPEGLLREAQERVQQHIEQLQQNRRNFLEASALNHGREARIRGNVEEVPAAPISPRAGYQAQTRAPRGRVNNVVARVIQAAPFALPTFGNFTAAAARRQEPHPAPLAPGQEVERKPLEDCPICMEDIEAHEETVWCKRQCGQNFHAECFRPWKEGKEREREHIRCPFCRAFWA